MENANYTYKLIITIAATPWYQQILPEAYRFFSDDTLSRWGSVIRKPISGDFYQLKCSYFTEFASQVHYCTK